MTDQPQDIQRRQFLKGLTAAILGFLSLCMAWPFITYLFPVSSEGKGAKFIKVPGFPSLPVGKPTIMHFEDMDVQAFIKQLNVYDVWVIKHSESTASVFSPLCTHLNCRYAFVKNEFVCPCHGSIFDENGKVIGGPAPRPLDTLPHKIEGGELYVQWILFKAGIPQKVEI